MLRMVDVQIGNAPPIRSLYNEERMHNHFVRKSLVGNRRTIYLAGDQDFRIHGYPDRIDMVTLNYRGKNGNYYEMKADIDQAISVFMDVTEEVQLPHEVNPYPYQDSEMMQVSLAEHLTYTHGESSFIVDDDNPRFAACVLENPILDDKYINWVIVVYDLDEETEYHYGTVYSAWHHIRRGFPPTDGSSLVNVIRKEER